MNKMSGFKTGSTVNACTRGLWAWGRPIPIENGSHMIIIDSEGFGSVEKDRELNIDLKIFTLCVLMSSCVIYNTYIFFYYIFHFEIQKIKTFNKFNLN